MIEAKLKEYGVEMEDHAVCDDKPEMITEAIHKMLDKGMDMTFAQEA